MLVTLRAHMTFSKSLYYSEHLWAEKMAQPSTMLTIKNKEDLYVSLELISQALHSLHTYVEPRACKKVSFHVSNGINPPASSMNTAPTWLTENGVRGRGYDWVDKEPAAQPWGPGFGSQEPT